MTKTELKKNINKIKGLILGAGSDYEKIDAGIELARSLSEPAVFEALLDGCAIDGQGKIIRNSAIREPETHTNYDPATDDLYEDTNDTDLDYILWNLVGYAPGIAKIDSSIKKDNISIINFDYTSFDELPAWLSDVKHLRHLSYNHDHYSSQKVTGSVIGSLTNLESCSLQYCGLTNLPDEVGNLKKLKSLNLSNNGFTSIPKGLCECENLEYLNLGHSYNRSRGIEKYDKLYVNKITSLPKSFANLNKLTSLKLNGCEELQSIEHLSNLANLTNLDLTDCKKVKPKPAEKGMTTREEVAAYQEKISKSIK